MGLVAQEVREIIREAVVEGDDEQKMLGMNNSDLMPVLIRGVQEQQTIIDDQKRKLEAMEARLARLERVLETRLSSR